MTSPLMGHSKGDAASAVAILAVVPVALTVVAATGGPQSPYLALLLLPVILAVVRCSFTWTVAIACAVGIGYLSLLLPLLVSHSLTSEEVGRAATMGGVAFAGALYARWVRTDRERLRATVEEQEAMLDVSQMLNATDKLEHGLNAALLSLKAILPDLTSAAIYLIDEQRQELVRESALSARSDAVRLPLDLEIPGWDLDSAQPFVSQDPDRAGASIGCIDQSARSGVIASLRSLNVPIGLIYVGTDQRRGLSARDAHLVQAFAERVSFPIQKLRLQEGLRNLAYTDPMTGLFNYRAFSSNLDDELKRAQRYEHPLSLILLDLDAFKAVNDRFGHPAGDTLLVSIAAVLRDAVRATDLPARYGGEEFAVICPETDLHEAAIVAERLRSAVADARASLPTGEICTATCSIGVATWPDHTSTARTLVDAADAALYAAKAAGRNRVCSAQPDAIPVHSPA